NNEVLAGGDRICIICREDMITAKQVPCGHKFHYDCLRTWLERNHKCPTCMTPVDAPTNSNNSNNNTVTNNNNNINNINTNNNNNNNNGETINNNNNNI